MHSCMCVYWILTDAIYLLVDVMIMELFGETGKIRQGLIVHKKYSRCIKDVGGA